MSSLLTREAILARDDEQSETVEVPEWDGSVRVRGLTGRERDLWEQSLTEDKPGRRRKKKEAMRVNMDNMRAGLCALCIVDEDGKRLFAQTDVVALGEKNAAAIDKLFDVATRLSGISEDDVDDLAEAMTESPFDASSSA